LIAVTLCVLLIPLFVLLGWLTIESMVKGTHKRPATRAAAGPVPLTGEPPHVPAHPASAPAERVSSSR
jgi:hypothetical protein